MIQRVLLFALSGLVTAGLYTAFMERKPDPGLINLAVRATVFAMPTPTARIVEVEVTRVVEVTRIVEVVRVVEATSTPLPIATPTWTPTPLAAVATPVSPRMAMATAPPPTPQAVALQASGCPVASSREYAMIPVLGAATDHPDAQHGDLNLALRGYVAVEGAAMLVDINGPTDNDAPQLAGILGRGPEIAALYRVRDWDWGCGERGCRGGELGHVDASALALRTRPGEAVYIPTRGPEIYGGGYVALVLYAEPTMLTLVYTREDSVANGYAVHLDGFCVDPALLARYRSGSAAGRGMLPALRNGEPVGSAAGEHIVVAVRDRGTFKDPRSRKDWWQGY